MVVFFLASCAGLFLLWRKSNDAQSCIVQSAKGVVVISLPKDTSLLLKGPVGKTLVEIKGRRVRVRDSDCRNKLCIRMGSIDQTGQIIICVPNWVVIWLKGKGGFDGVTR